MDSEELDYERTLVQLPQCHVFKIPTRRSADGHRASDWPKEPTWSGKCKVIAKGKTAAVVLVDQNNATFAVCPVTDDSAVERVLDSGRYFVLRIQNAQGKHAFIGIAFNERNDAFDFNVALQEHKDSNNREKQAQATTSLPQLSNLIPALKEGEKIKISLGSGNNSNANNANKPKKSPNLLGAASGGAGGSLLAPPPRDASRGLAPPPKRAPQAVVQSSSNAGTSKPSNSSSLLDDMDLLGGGSNNSIANFASVNANEIDAFGALSVSSANDADDAFGGFSASSAPNTSAPTAFDDVFGGMSAPLQNSSVSSTKVASVFDSFTSPTTAPVPAPITSNTNAFSAFDSFSISTPSTNTGMQNASISNKPIGMGIDAFAGIIAPSVGTGTMMGGGMKVSPVSALNSLNDPFSGLGAKLSTNANPVTGGPAMLGGNNMMNMNAFNLGQTGNNNVGTLGRSIAGNTGNNNNGAFLMQSTQPVSNGMNAFAGLGSAQSNMKMNMMPVNNAPVGNVNMFGMSANATQPSPVVPVPNNDPFSSFGSFSATSSNGSNDPFGSGGMTSKGNVGSPPTAAFSGFAASNGLGASMASSSDPFSAFSTTATAAAPAKDPFSGW